MYGQGPTRCGSCILAPRSHVVPNCSWRLLDGAGPSCSRGRYWGAAGLAQPRGPFLTKQDDAHKLAHRASCAVCCTHRYGNSKGGGGGFTWSFAGFEAQYVGPIKEVLSPAARVTVSSQVGWGSWAA